MLFGFVTFISKILIVLSLFGTEESETAERRRCPEAVDGICGRQKHSPRAAAAR